MHRILNNTIIPVKPGIFIKDPLSSDLGKKVLEESLVLIDELGMEAFNFKRLSAHVGSTEAAIYRYFENKHKILLYYINWYWGWLEHNLVYGTANMDSPKDKIKMAVNLLVVGPSFHKNLYLNISLLRRVVTEESSKAFMTKEVDSENSNGFFDQFYNFSERVVNIFLEYNPNHPFPKAFVSTLIWSTLLNSFCSKHVPDLIEDDFIGQDKVDFYYNLVFNSLINE
ncbi:TetR/AcrR family transcriptional regulator [uncultured Cyclobacterium sp.]|uniref:TetR/AcrR family transcriptional regulator n=1 Tax=uncultured Cyclobacterium sp. TaxID=453820 RepID=UPI0030EF5000|tara:strand:- start:48776 stop:49453 length:678 start_codon:yes stop_codon:yes gene_type:complete